MSSPTLPERYLLLALRLERHVDGLVDAYYGPGELRDRAAREDPADAEALLDEARTLRDDVERSDLEPQRRRWLAAQLGGLECVAQKVAGQDPPWREAVRRCYGIEVEAVPEERFETAHEALDAVLPGDGALAERLERWNTAQNVPRDKLLPAFRRLLEELRARTRDLVGLPEGEDVEAVEVADKPWGAYNWYLGGLRSRVELNVDLPTRSHFVAVLAAHEGYPGHHTEHAYKEARLVDELGRAESSIQLIHTPECLLSEGIAEVAIEQALGADWVDAVARMLAPLGIPVDSEVVRVLDSTGPALGAAGVNVALFTGEGGMHDEEAVAYLRRWGLLEEERARKAVGFATHPMWGIYVPCYTYGKRLVRSFVDADSAGFRRLLTEQLTTDDLLAAANP